jgi:23S rRNA (cytosine1962-C5)-methyltransferase
MERRDFDLVILDPPALAKGPFHTVDLVNDYQSLFKPSLLACAPGGTVLAANNVGSVSREVFGKQLERCADKAGRPLRGLEWLNPDEDFPSFDGHHPLKIAVCLV